MTKPMADEYSDTMNGKAGSELILPELRLESGVVLKQVPVKYQTWGELNKARSNTLLVCHALTGNHQLDCWWGGLLGPGLPFDTTKFFVICINVLCSPYGSCSPLTTDPDSGKAYAASFPMATIRDAINMQAALLTALGITEVQCVVGGSMGGMLALEFCFRTVAPKARAGVFMSCNGRHSAWQIGISELQRSAIMADPKFNGGNYSPDAPPASGMFVARQIAMVTYRTHNAYDTKFGRKVQRAPDVSPPGSVAAASLAPPQFEVER